MHATIKTFAQVTAVLVTVFILSSCTPKDTTQAGSEESEKRTQAQLRDLEKKIEAQSASVTRFQKAADDMEKRVQGQLRDFDKKIDAQSETLNRFQQSTTDAVDKKAATMGQTLAELFTKLEGEVRSQITSLRQSFLGEKTAVLEPGSKGYSYLSTDKGVFLFIVDGAEPFLDGHKILVRVGNPMNMTFSGFKLKVRYGKRPPTFPSLDINDSSNKAAFEKWATDNSSWEKTVRKTEIAFTESLAAGAWTKIDFALKETKPEDVAFLEVGIVTDQISLRKPLENLK